jgi:FkbM family methyltransferase
MGHQHWIPRGRDRLLRLLCDPDDAPPIGFVVPFYGAVYSGRLDNFIDWSVFHYGGYARHELMLLSEIARILGTLRGRPCAFFDVGANVGNHALCMAAQGNAVFAFEPYAPVRALLVDKLAANPGLPIRVFEFGLADRDALLAFRAPSGSNFGTGSFQYAAAPGAAALHLPVRRGDSALDALCLPPIDILKIDVEGMEPEVLRGLQERLRIDRPVILFELSEGSREVFNDIAGLRALLYPEHVLLDVGARTVSGPYRLAPFDFLRSSEAVVIPTELWPILGEALKTA